jgi:hypothetical protein
LIKLTKEDEIGYVRQLQSATGQRKAAFGNQCVPGLVLMFVDWTRVRQDRAFVNTIMNFLFPLQPDQLSEYQLSRKDSPRKFV